MSSSSDIILNSSLNKTSTTTTMQRHYHHHHTRRSFHLSSETIQEEETPPLPPSSSSLAEENENITTAYIKRHTPILFSTNRGLHLRTTNTLNNNITVAATTSSHNSTSSHHSSARNTNSSTLRNSNYNIAFCDLERWSTNRANTISLEDTFTIPKPAVVPSSAASGSLASTSLRFLPHKATTTAAAVRFSGYSRFDVE